MDVNTLNALVEQRHLARRATRTISRVARRRFVSVARGSKLEEELAKIKPAEDAEGRIARRGAVRAALKANNFARAKELVLRFSVGRFSKNIAK
jgi:hypothetical protein